MHPTLRLHDGYPDHNPDLRSEVQVLQNILIRWGFPISSDGKYGNGTFQAVQIFQRKFSVGDDGVVGPKTWNLLDTKTPTNIGSGYRAPQPPADAPQYSAIAQDLSAKITGSKHFTWREALWLPSWGRAASASEVTPTILSNIVRQAAGLDRVRDHFNASINVHCWLRPTAYNAHIGGARNSAHLRGAATDFDVSGKTANQVRQVLRADPTIYPGCGELGVSWVHLDLEHRAWFNP